VDGKIERYIHLERYTGRKNDNRLPMFIETIIKEELDLKEEFDLVSVNSFVGNSFISQTGRLRIEPSEKLGIKSHAQKAVAWFQSTPWGGFSPSSQIVSHELAHVFSCLPFFGEFKENSLLVHFDGGASQSNFSAFHYQKGQLKVVEYHWDLSHLSKIFNDNALSFALMQAKPGEHCSVPGKLMGYAAMGTANQDLMEWLITNNYFKDCWDDFTPFYKAAKTFNWNGQIANNEDVFLMDVAASLQAIFQQSILQKLQALQRQTKAEFLYYTGGCALNIGTNSKILTSQFFEDVFIPPACNDSGLSLGAAALVNWTNHQSIQSHTPYLNFKSDPSNSTIKQENIKEAARQIMKGAIIGLFTGNGEVGPRALGNRSIIARADSKTIAQKVSRYCKGREWFRPIAPVMLERNAKRVIGLSSIHHLSRYMLLDFQILPTYQKQLKGVTHTNGTARIQTLFERKTNRFLYDLLDYIEEEYQQIGLINTSFNQRGMPIVQTVEDAKKAAKAMCLNSLIVNGELIKI